MDWINSIYSDGSKYYVTPESPTIGDQVTIGLRMLDNDQVKGVRLRRVKNGSEHLDTMEMTDKQGPFIIYTVSFTMNQPEIHWHFYIFTDTELYFYNQYELTQTLPTEDYDFRLVAGYESPKWVRKSVFYQIFPDRFFNGNPDNDVENGEYMFDGHPTVKMAWEEAPKEYDEVFCLDFYGGDLEGIEAKIPYFKDMGFSALYINPIFHSATSHRYDCLDYFRVDPHLGGDKALADLTDSLHQEDMKLILDVSINHTGTAHKWFNKENAFFGPEKGAYQNPNSRERHYYFFDEDNDYHKWYDVETLPTLNYTSAELRDILYRSPDSLVKKWLNPPYNIDGWRFDVANDMARMDAIDLSHEVWPEIFTSIKEENPQAYVLAEQWMDCADYLQGGEWDSPMNYFGCGRPARQFVGDGDLFVNRDPEMRHLPQPMTADQLRERIMKHFAKIPYALGANQFNLLDSHDVARLHNNEKISFDAYEIAVMLMYLLPGAPNVYYGDEVGLEGHLKSVEGCRCPMEWSEDRWDQSYVQLYSTLNRLKLDNEVLHDGGFKFLYSDGKVTGIARFTDNEVILMIASMEDEPRDVLVPVELLGVDETWTALELLGKDPFTESAAALRASGLHLRMPAQRGYLFSLTR